MDESEPQLPDASALRLAIGDYLQQAYGSAPPAQVVEDFLPPDDVDPVAWLMRDVVVRDPPDAPLPHVRSFALRVGNRRYPYMKIRLSRPPGKRMFIFSVDAHDAILHAPTGSTDAAALAQLKRFNAQLTHQVMAVWDAAHLPTERSYMRQMIEQAKRRKAQGGTRCDGSSADGGGADGPG